MNNKKKNNKKLKKNYKKRIKKIEKNYKKRIIKRKNFNQIFAQNLEIF